MFRKLDHVTFYVHIQNYSLLFFTLTRVYFIFFLPEILVYFPYSIENQWLWAASSSLRLPCLSGIQWVRSQLKLCLTHLWVRHYAYIHLKSQKHLWYSYLHFLISEWRFSVFSLVQHGQWSQVCLNTVPYSARDSVTGIVCAQLRYPEWMKKGN